MANRPNISFKTIVPKKGFLFDLFEEEIRKAMEQRVRPQLRAMFYQTTAGWEDTVDFRGTIRSEPGRYIKLTVQAYGSNKWLYDMLARGADPHVIRPVTSEYLRFQEGYIAGTTPYSLRSRRKQRFGDTIYTQQVFHPGFEGRYWDVVIAREYAPTFRREMISAINIFSQKQALEFKKGQKSETPVPVQRR